jgi:hypothetical protein
MPFMRAALTILSGTDRGPTKEEWQAWWREAEKARQPVPELRPEVPPFAREAWVAFWGEPYAAEVCDAAPLEAAAEPPDPRDPMEIVLSPTPGQAAAAVEAIESAARSKGGDEAAVIAAIDAGRRIVDPSVVIAVAKTLDGRSYAVRGAALDALGRMPHELALRVLHETYRRDRSIRDDEHLLPKLLKAIGRHADRSSIEILADRPLQNLSREVGTARLYGLARVRHVDSVEAIMKLMTLGGSPRPSGGPPSGGARFLEEKRIALCVLTGEDHGASKEAWLAWWRKAKRGYRVSDSMPRVPPLVRETFEEYWR